MHISKSEHGLAAYFCIPDYVTANHVKLSLESVSCLNLCLLKKVECVVDI